MNSGINWSDVLFGSLYCMAQRSGGDVFRKLWNVVMEENGQDKRIRESNEEVLEHIGENRTLLNNTLHRKSNWIGHILRNCLLHYTIEGKIMGLKGVGRRTQFLDLKNKKKILGAKGGSWERKSWKQVLSHKNKEEIQVHGPVKSSILNDNGNNWAIFKTSSSLLVSLWT